MRSRKRIRFMRAVVFSLFTITSVPSLLWAQRMSGGAVKNASSSSISTTCVPERPDWNGSEVPVEMAGWHSIPLQRSYGLSQTRAQAGMALLSRVDQMMRRIPALSSPPPGVQLTVRKVRKN